MLIANYIGLKRQRPDRADAGPALVERHGRAVRRRRRVGHGAVVRDGAAVAGADRACYGDVFGLPFSLEGIFFFLEAIFITIYIFGWKHLSPWAHFWSGVVLPFVAIGGVFSIISANGWMNSPTGFMLGADGRPTNIDPIAAIFNQAVVYEFPHMLAAAYMTAGFLVAGVFAHGAAARQLGSLPPPGVRNPFTVAAIVAPLQMLIGDTVARSVFQQMPIKFAAIELVWTTGPDKPEILLGA